MKNVNYGIVVLLFTFCTQAIWGQNDNAAIKSDSINSVNALYAVDSLQQTVQYLEDIYEIVENSEIGVEIKQEKIREFIRRGTKMEKILERNFSILHPENETMKTDCVRRFHLILQSLVIYRSDISDPNYEESENFELEQKYLKTHIPELIERLTEMTRYHKFTDWNKQKKMDELNGFLQNAYGNEPPVFFTLEGIHSTGIKPIPWAAINNMLVDRTNREVIIKTESGQEIRFNYTENQYTDIASMHVHFLAFFEKLK